MADRRGCFLAVGWRHDGIRCDIERSMDSQGIPRFHSGDIGELC